MSAGRMHRVDTAIRHVLGEALAGELKDPRVGFVTVTDVRTSADLRHARVYVSVLAPGGSVASQAEREMTLDGLRSAHGYLQGRIASELRLKRTPTLDFVYDDTTDRAMRVEELLEEARGEEAHREEAHREEAHREEAHREEAPGERAGGERSPREEARREEAPGERAGGEMSRGEDAQGEGSWREEAYREARYGEEARDQ